MPKIQDAENDAAVADIVAAVAVVVAPKTVSSTLAAAQQTLVVPPRDTFQKTPQTSAVLSAKNIISP